jgi:hypothetical protein
VPTAAAVAAPITATPITPVATWVRFSRKFGADTRNLMARHDDVLG